MKTLDDLASLLEVTRSQLGYYLFRANRYRSFQLAKKSGGSRTIHTPDNALKLIQRKLSQVLQAVYKGRAPVHGFAVGRSIVTNARRHLNCAILLNLDLTDFFPSIHFGRVLGLFSGKPYWLPYPVALTVARICCFQKALPAGAPTSPVVSNMICAKMDSQLKELAIRHKCTYTRYADDITFSTDLDRFPPAIAYRDRTSKKWFVGDQVNDVITKNGFNVNLSKTRVGTRHSRREVTGILLSDRLNVKRSLVRQVRAMLHAWERYGEAAADTEFRAKYDTKQRADKTPSLRYVLLGKLGFIGFIRGGDDALFLRLRERYEDLNPDSILKPITLGPYATGEVIAQAIWLLEGDENDPYAQQATAFAVENYGLLTAAHAVHKMPMFASRPQVSPKKYPVTVVKKDEDHDIAQIHVARRLPVQLRIGSSDHLKQGMNIALLGFPRYHIGDGVHMSQGPITQDRVYFGVKHFVIQPTVARGNSGGPVLDSGNRVVGIAVKGVDTPGKFSQSDELSSFVPVSELVYLKYPTTNQRERLVS